MKRMPTGGDISFNDLYESMDHLNEAEVHIRENSKMQASAISALETALKFFRKARSSSKDIANAISNTQYALQDAISEWGDVYLDESQIDHAKRGARLVENSTTNAAKTLDAILGMFKGHEDNDLYKMGKGIKDHYKKEGSFSPDQAKWIWKTSVALFKK